MFTWDPRPNTEDRTETEYAKRIDCEKNGCNPPHSDNGHIQPIITKEGKPTHSIHTIRKKGPLSVNGHACTLVTRTVTYTGWKEA